MSTTSKYSFMFLIPTGLSDTPIPFEVFKKEDGSYYTYNEYMALDGNQAFYTPSNTHAMLSMNATSIFDLASKFPQYLAMVSPSTVIKEGVDTTAWLDSVQDNYLWIVPTEPGLPYNFEEFAKATPLFNITQETPLG